jgi:putative selenium metabolism protein SsnA
LVVELGGRVEQADVHLGERVLDAPTGKTRDATGCVVMPGLILAHTHVYSALARGMPGDGGPAPRTFVDILKRIWWKLDAALDPASIESSALAGARDAVLCGVTTIVDHHASPSSIEGSLDLVAGAFAKIGARGVHAYEVTDRHGPDGAKRGVAENARFLRANARPTQRGLVGAHASFTMSDNTVAACASLAKDRGVGLHIHIAEDRADVEDARAKGGIIARLERVGALNDRAVLAHAVHLDDDQRARVNASGATVVHNARSNMNNAVGYARPLEYIRSATGTDGIDGDLFEENRSAYFRGREHDVGTFAEGATARLLGGALLAERIFGMPFGTLRPGAAGDAIVLEYDPPTPIHSGNVAWHLAFGMRASHVRDVFVAGEPVVLDRKLVNVDERELAARAREQARALWARMV